MNDSNTGFITNTTNKPPNTINKNYKLVNKNYRNNVINYPFIDYIIKAYIPHMQLDKQKYGKIDMKYFRESMMHYSTQIGENDSTYERLEYLGDAIFHMIITEYLYKRYDEENEGFITRLRIRTERGDSMAELTMVLGLDQYIQLHGIGINDHILEDVFEAFIGAFYINFGIRYVRDFIVKLIEKHKDLSAMIYYDDNYKDLLLRYFHQMKWGHPKYGESKLPDGKYFITIKDPLDKNETIGKGISPMKQKAEQYASKKALIKFGVIVDGEIDHDWINKIEKVESEEKVKEKKGKKPLPIFNPNNKLFTKKSINELVSVYGITISSNIKLNLKIFNEAMTHKSYLIRKKLSKEDLQAAKKSVKLQKKSNERLKILGDSVIHFVIGELLFNTFKNRDEGFLTRLRCKLENRKMLYYLAKKTKIGNYVLVSQNIEVLHGRTNINIIGGGFEAFVGALYLELGLSITREFVNAVISTELNINEIVETETNYKELVMQFFNKNKLGYPVYKIMKEDGPDHLKIFTVGLYYSKKLFGKGKASSKKEAEQIAAKQMYDTYINNID